jgi:hypothetical protein
MPDAGGAAARACSTNRSAPSSCPRVALVLAASLAATCVVPPAHAQPSTDAVGSTPDTDLAGLRDYTTPYGPSTDGSRIRKP